MEPRGVQCSTGTGSHQTENKCKMCGDGRRNGNPAESNRNNLEEMNEDENNNMEREVNTRDELNFQQDGGEHTVVPVEEATAEAEGYTPLDDLMDGGGDWTTVFTSEQSDNPGGGYLLIEEDSFHDGESDGDEEEILTEPYGDVADRALRELEESYAQAQAQAQTASLENSMHIHQSNMANSVRIDAEKSDCFPIRKAEETVVPISPSPVYRHHPKQHEETSSLSLPQREAEAEAEANDVNVKLSAMQVDVDAVKKAMRNVRIKSPEAYQEWCDRGLDRSSIATCRGSISLHSNETERKQSASPTNSRACGGVGVGAVVPSHWIIPPTPLRAYFRDTPTARAATARTTRSATMAEAFVRMKDLLFVTNSSTGPPTATGAEDGLSWSCSDVSVHCNLLQDPQPQPQSVKVDDGDDDDDVLLPLEGTTTTTTTTRGKHGDGMELVIHVIGTDHVECDRPEAVFGPFVRWLDTHLLRENICGFGWSSVHFALIGPNISVERTLDVSPIASASRRLKRATVSLHRGLYHQISHEGSVGQIDERSSLSQPPMSHLPSPHFLIAFNAGLWGYDDWTVTLKSLPTNVPFVVTSYTIEEAEDDHQVLCNIDDDGSQWKCLWGPEPNPFSSRMPRKTYTAPNGRNGEYFENGAWQCWMRKQEIQ